MFDYIKGIDIQATLLLNGSNSIFWDNLAVCVTNTLAWSLIILTLIVIFFRNNDLRGGIIILVTIALMMTTADMSCSGLVKPLVGRFRPTQDPSIMYMVDVVNGYRGGRYGFFSGHACNTFCMAMFLSRLFRYKAVTITLFFWAATTTFTRLYLGVHFLGDVLVGGVVGCLIGAFFYFIYEKFSSMLHVSKLVSDQFTSTGYKKKDMNVLLSVIFMNYIFIIIFSLSLGV